MCECVCSLDVNECEEREKEMEEEGGGELKPLCEEGKYCFNMQGTYKCNGMYVTKLFN